MAASLRHRISSGAASAMSLAMTLAPDHWVDDFRNQLIRAA
jgi:hypothetical protein